MTMSGQYWNHADGSQRYTDSADEDWIWVPRYGWKTVKHHEELELEKGAATMNVMNYSTAVFLVRDDVRAIKTSYERDHEGKGVRPFTTFKSLDTTLKVGDFLVVPTGTRHEMTVVRIEEVDVEVDLNSGKELSWIVAPIDSTNYDAIVEQEKLAIDKIKSAERTRARAELMQKLVEDNPDLAELRGVNPIALQSPPISGS